MKWSVQWKERRNMAMLLLVILVLALVNNFFSRRQYDDLTKNVSSIYQDRLIPASYIFRMSNLFYQKKILLDSLPGKNIGDQLILHNREMDQIVEAYETTYLTNDEKQQWQNFKQSLQRYNNAEFLAITSAATVDRAALSAGFDKTLESLKQLNEIQTSEGMRLQNDSKAIINKTVTQAYLEVSLLFILGIIALMLLTTSEKVVYPVPHRYLYN